MYDRPVKMKSLKTGNNLRFMKVDSLVGLELFITQTHFLIGGFARQDTYPPKQKRRSMLMWSLHLIDILYPSNTAASKTQMERSLAGLCSPLYPPGQGSLITLDLGYNLKANLDLLFQSTFVTSWAGDEDSKFFNKYRQNDTLALGARYVF